MTGSLTLTKSYAVPVHRLYSAWCEPAQMRCWFAPDDMRVPEAEADVRTGGRYRIVMEAPDGQRHIVSGHYLEVLPDRLLRFSWLWEGSNALTEVELSFREIDPGNSELTLTHRQFTDDDARDKHGKGWNGCLNNLRTHLST